MTNDITGEAEEIRAAIRAAATRQYLEKRDAAAAALYNAQAPAWQQQLDASRAKHKAEEAQLLGSACAAIYGDDAIDAEVKALDFAAERAIYEEGERDRRRARRLAWRRQYYQRNKSAQAQNHNTKP